MGKRGRLPYGSGWPITLWLGSGHYVGDVGGVYAGADVVRTDQVGSLQDGYGFGSEGAIQALTDRRVGAVARKHSSDKGLARHACRNG